MTKMGTHTSRLVTKRVPRVGRWVEYFWWPLLVCLLGAAAAPDHTYVCCALSSGEQESWQAFAADRRPQIGRGWWGCSWVSHALCVLPHVT